MRGRLGVGGEASDGVGTGGDGAGFLADVGPERLRHGALVNERVMRLTKPSPGRNDAGNDEATACVAGVLGAAEPAGTMAFTAMLGVVIAAAPVVVVVAAAAVAAEEVGVTIVGTCAAGLIAGPRGDDCGDGVERRARSSKPAKSADEAASATISWSHREALKASVERRNE